MNETVEIHYSKGFAYFAPIVMMGLISFLTYIVLTDDPTKWKGRGLVYLIVIAIILLTLTFYLILKYLIPALKGQNALVLNDELIIDNISNNVIKWDNVSGIRSLNSRGSNFIAIDLINSLEVTQPTRNILKKISYANNKFFYGTPILIPTQFLEGSDKKLIEIFLSFFQQR